ncbi:MAG: type I-D CRISPR-associated protein Cas5/Csc1 [Anaerolineae bacterium]|nr:type I-D CRISPR-associated protein Cas5/Csc1 [Anaerolineae bacterium]
MHIYRGTIDLLDYVFYATVERGKVYETGAFVHNYALVYALKLVQSDTYTYAQLVQKPHYEEELTALNDCLYFTPASPQHFSHRLVQWNTLREAYAFPGKPPSLGYPDWGFARVLRPGSQFRFYLLVNDLVRLPPAPALRDLLDGKVRHIRLGKFLGKACVQLSVASSVHERQGSFQVDAFLNWRDLESDPLACDIVATSLPTRLLARASFDEDRYYEAHFQDEQVLLPAQMRFLARLLKPSKRSRRKR